MVATQSSMQSLGSRAPDVNLPDVSADNQLVSLQHMQGKPLLVMFICNHCPYVIHLIEALTRLANQSQANGVGVIAISSNDVVNYPQDGPVPMRAFANEHGFQFPYCYDETQSVARAYGAECTPDFFVYDSQHLLRYRGQMDSSRPGNGQVADGADLAAAIAAILSGDAVNPIQVPSIGCNIKWKADA